jgi:hypothetical protein
MVFGNIRVLDRPDAFRFENDARPQTWVFINFPVRKHKGLNYRANFTRSCLFTKFCFSCCIM